jgi:hypothetical protein
MRPVVPVPQSNPQILMLKQLAAWSQSLKRINGAILNSSTVQRTLDLLIIEHLAVCRDKFESDLPVVVEQTNPTATVKRPLGQRNDVDVAAQQTR